MTYLTKVQRIDFSLGTSSEWSEIQHYNRLRNCIVHNQGRLNEGYRKEQLIKLADYINSSESGLTIFGDQIIFDKEFCRKALKTVKNFLIQVLSAKTNVR